LSFVRLAVLGVSTIGLGSGLPTTDAAAAPCLPLPLLFSLLLALLIAIEIVLESSLNYYFEASLLPF